MIVDVLLRLVVISVGLVFAGAATVVALFFTLRGPIAAAGRAAGDAAAATSDFESSLDAVLALMRIFGAMVGGFTMTTALAVALAAIVVAEVVRVRSWLYYVVGGGVALGAAAAVQGLDLALLDVALPGFAISLVAAGFIGGAVYWFIAGRRAGI